jgi:metacaspase-1
MFEIPSTFSHGKSLIVGINYYDTKDAKLYGCINDGILIENIAKTKYDFHEEDITFLRDDSKDPHKIPTKENIVKSLKNIVDESYSLRDIWFHYSGHGAFTDDMSGDEIDGKDEFLIPSDFKTNGVILDDDLFAIISKAKCPVFLTMDCCHSGSIMDLTYSFDVNRYGIVRKIENKYKIENENIYMLSGCKDDQTSDDVQYAHKAQGAFTQALVDCLKHHHYEPNIVDLFVSIRNVLGQRGHSQKTLLSSSNIIPHVQLKCNHK